MNLQKVMLVTGVGNKRLGWHVAQEAAARGYSVVVQYRESESEAKELVSELTSRNIVAQAFRADFSLRGEASRLLSEVNQTFGSLDVLVHCASTWPKVSLEDTDEELLARTFQDNTISSFMCAKEAGLLFAKQSTGGVIVQVSDWAVHRPYLDHAAYFAAKGSIETLTKVFAKELGVRNPNIRVNAILPGPLAVPDTISEDERRRIVDSTILKRLGKPEHFVQTVFFLIDNDFITGASITVDGGRSIV